jgi:hypothetical protein
LQKGTEIPPFEELLKNKTLLAFGSDWGTPQPLENIQTYSSMLKILGLPAERAHELLALHTKNGARALGLENDVGTLEVGKKADIVFINISDFRFGGILAEENTEKVLDIVLQEATSQLVSEVMINGEFYVREKHLLTYSEDDLAIEAQALLKKFASFGVQKPSAAPPSAAIFQLPAAQRSEPDIQEGDLHFEEGFRVVQKNPIALLTPEKKNETIEPGRELPKNVRKIFGADDL